MTTRASQSLAGPDDGVITRAPGASPRTAQSAEATPLPGAARRTAQSGPQGCLPALAAVLCQSPVFLPGWCGQILLPSRCHKDQGPTAVPGNQAPDLPFPGSGGGI